MKALDIPVDEVNLCMYESFDREGDYTSYNEMLFDDREAAVDLGI